MDELRHRLERWTATAAAEGWLGEQELQRLRQVENQQAEVLFRDQGRRPLIVAFFGGTGVGKSSLLNRLAGEAIARVGVERPTSREVTLYLHRSCRLADLPPELPLDATRIAWHDDDRRRRVAWLDLPDIDSVQENHRQLVEAWLPYVDWLIYVVSPERYQDERGWRFVQQRGGRHAWLFVINQWDLGGAPEQLEAFSRRLREAGFERPVILRTRCDGGDGEDDFAELEGTIARAIEEYGMDDLQRLAGQARERELRQLGQECLQRLGRCREPQLEQAWRALVAGQLQRIREELALDARRIAARLAPRESGWWRRERTPEVSDPEELLRQLWSPRVETRLQDLATGLDRLLLEHSVPRPPFTEALKRLGDEGREAFRRAAAPALAGYLARPGGPMGRFWRRLLRELGWLLPLGAAGWVVYYLVQGFYLGTRQGGGFLGVDYAVHSLMLIGLAWFIPWLLQLKATPSPAATVEGALQRAGEAGCGALQQLLEGVLERRCSEATALANRLERELAETGDGRPVAQEALAGRLTANPGKVAGKTSSQSE